MTNEKIKRMFDAFYQAKRIRDMLPPLPQGVMPSYIQYLDVIHSLQREKKDIRLSDISDAMNLPRPGVTRTVKEKERGFPGSMIRIISAVWRPIFQRFPKKKQTI